MEQVYYNLHPLNFLIISGILQIIILSFIIFFHQKGNIKANKVLSVFIFISALHFGWYMVIDSNIEQIIGAYFLWIPYSYLLSLGPLIYFYTRILTTSNFQFSLKHSLHFLPATAEVLLQLLLIIEGISSNRQFYDNTYFIVFKIIQILFTCTSLLVYANKSMILIKSHEKSLIDNFSNYKNITLLWLYRLIKYMRILWFFWLSFEMTFIIFWRFQLHAIPVYLLLYVLLIIATYSTYWIGIEGLKKTESLPENEDFKNHDVMAPNSYSNLGSQEISSIIEKLQRLMTEEKMFLHETLSLKTLSNRIHVEPNLISFVLNSKLNKPFYDFVNEYRIEEVKEKMKDPKYAHFKLVELAYESGFNSKATFNRVFKKLEGLTPTAYRNEMTASLTAQPKKFRSHPT